MGGGPWGDWWAAGRRPWGCLAPARGCSHRGAPPILFLALPKKRMRRARWKRKRRLGALRCSGPPRVRGSAYRCKRRFCLAVGHARVFCDFCNCRPVADGAEGVGVVVALNCFSLRCRWPVVDGSRGSGPMWASAPMGTPTAFCLVWYKPLQLPGQRVAERNARKEELVKCVLAARCCRHPRRGNPLSNPHRTPPRPSDSPRKPAGTISRRPPYSAEARRRRSATKAIFSLPPCAAHSLFVKTKKRMGGAPPWDTPSAGAASPWPPDGGSHHSGRWITAPTPPRWDKENGPPSGGPSLPSHARGWAF